MQIWRMWKIMIRSRARRWQRTSHRARQVSKNASWTSRKVSRRTPSGVRIDLMRLPRTWRQSSERKIFRWASTKSKVCVIEASSASSGAWVTIRIPASNGGHSISRRNSWKEMTRGTYAIRATLRIFPSTQDYWIRDLWIILAKIWAWRKTRKAFRSMLPRCIRMSSRREDSMEANMRMYPWDQLARSRRKSSKKSW